jgi:hypothetical protein
VRRNITHRNVTRSGTKCWKKNSVRQSAANHDRQENRT